MFFESFLNELLLLLQACEGHCTGSGPKSCAKCKAGYNMNTEHGCLVNCFLSVAYFIMLLIGHNSFFVGSVSFSYEIEPPISMLGEPSVQSNKRN